MANHNKQAPPENEQNPPEYEPTKPLVTKYIFLPSAPRQMTLIKTERGYDPNTGKVKDIPGVVIKPQMYVHDPRVRYVDLADDPSLRRAVAPTTVAQLVTALQNSLTWGREQIIPLSEYEEWREIEIKEIESIAKAREAASKAADGKKGKRGGAALRDMFMS